MALKQKVDYFGLSASGFEVTDTAENKAAGFIAEARGDDNFLVAVDASGEVIKPTVDYVVTGSAELTSVKLGDVKEILGKKIALGGITINTAAGQAPTMQATGSQIEDDGTAHCTATLAGVTLSPLYHAQDFGLFTVTNGQLNSSTLTIEGEIGTTMVDGVIKSSDLVGASMRVAGSIVGVTDNGTIATPSVTINAPSGNVLSGVMTTPLSETNSNGQFPVYNFECMWGVKADANG